MGQWPSVVRRGAEATRWLWFMVGVGFAALAAWVAVSEPWDDNGGKPVSAREALLLVVRFLALPLRPLLNPKAVLRALVGNPVPSPSDAAAAGRAGEDDP